MPSVKALVEPQLLAWARGSANLEPIAAARKIRVPEGRIEEWESGERAPTIAELRRAGEVYNRPLGVFFLSAPPEGFAPIWEAIEDMIRAGQVRAVDEVKRELSRKSDEANAWSKRCPGLFVPLSREIQLATREILAKHPRLLGQGGGSRNGADPFVIALAHDRGGTVVTQETPRNLNKPRIPDVCDDLDIPWMTLPEFVDDQGWSIRVRF